MNSVILSLLQIMNERIIACGMRQVYEHTVELFHIFYQNFETLNHYPWHVPTLRTLDTFLQIFRIHDYCLWRMPSLRTQVIMIFGNLF